MGVSFAHDPSYVGFNRATRFDAYLADCEVEGEIPSDLHGTFYRMQCDFLYPPKEGDWGFNGDGHLSMFRFAAGHCEYRGRYILTDRMMAERAVRQRLWGVYRNHYTDDPSLAGVNRSAANTHMYLWQGKLLTLKEDARPVVVDPHTLDFVQSDYDFEGQYTAVSMSAHPKFDPLTGEMICYGYQARGDLTDDVAVYTFNAAGEKTHEVWFKAPYVGIMHDITLTQRHIVVPLVPMVTSEARLLSGQRMWEWDPSYPTMVAVVPRDGESKDVRWFEGPARSTLHFLNAVTENDRVVMDLPTSNGTGDPSQFRRWTMDLNSRDDRFEEEVLFENANGLLTRMDDRHLSLPYRYAWITDTDRARPWNAEATGRPGGNSNVVDRLDIRNKRTATWWVGDTHTLQEPTFAPRADDAPEGDGYFLVVASNLAEMRSELKIVDARTMEERATVILPFRLKSGTHGNWVPASQLPFSYA
jgi:carotenoid cleavage dioxygenase